MRPEDIQIQIESMKERAYEIEKQLEDPSLYSSLSLQKNLFRERQKLTEIFTHFDSWVKALSDAAGNRELIQTEQDEEFKILLESDLMELEKKAAEEEKALSLLLLPPDPNDGRSCIVEMRPAAGGDEADSLLPRCTIFIQNLQKNTPGNRKHFLFQKRDLEE